MNFALSAHYVNKLGPLVKAGLILLTALLVLVSIPAQAADPVFAPLEDHLISAGFSARTVRAWLAEPTLEFEGRLLAALLATPEHTLDYGQFLKKRVVKRAKRFARQHAVTLAKTREITGVAPPVVVAILTVESNLGSYTGRHRAFNVLASQGVLDTPAARQKLAQAWPRRKLAELKNPKLDARLNRRAAWAKEELIHLARLSQENGVPLASLKGSVAGAMGMSQFMPSSLALYGRDGDGDGRVNLQQPDDAIISVGEFLASHGWRPDLDPQAQAQVLFQYNRSRTYVRTILALAEKLG
jgi:membrane-bound lytic murein transglycosylase B